LETTSFPVSSIVFFFSFNIFCFTLVFISGKAALKSLEVLLSLKGFTSGNSGLSVSVVSPHQLKEYLEQLLLLFLHLQMLVL
jgi:hypothetical protein